MPSSEYYFDEEMLDKMRPREVVCTFCGTRKLHWHLSQRKVLVDARGAIHDCRGGPADPDEFSQE